MKLSFVLGLSALGLVMTPAVARDVSEYRVVHPADRFVSPMGGVNEPRYVWPEARDAISQAYVLFEQNKSEQAISSLKNAAADGDVIAMRALGQLYAHGRLPFGRRTAVETDALKSLNWFTAAAEAGDAPSMYLLGYLYQSNSVLTANPEKSSYWLGRAAKAGDYKVKRAVNRVTSAE